MVWLQPWMATSQILKEMFYGLVASVDDIIGDFERDAIRCACVRR